MSPLDHENHAAAGENNIPAAGAAKSGAPFGELCGEFLSALSRTAKNAGLYALKHPMVTESLRRAYVALGKLLESLGAPLTVFSGEDEWLFNGEPVPGDSQDSRNLGQMLKAHGVKGITFEPGVRASELAALCAFLATGGRSQPPGALGEFLSRMGVERIRPEEAHYVREISHGRGEEAGPAGRQTEQEIKPRPAAPSPAPESAPRPAAPSQRPAAPVKHPEVPEVKRDIPAPQAAKFVKAAATEPGVSGAAKVSGGAGGRTAPAPAPARAEGIAKSVPGISAGGAGKGTDVAGGRGQGHVGAGGGGGPGSGEGGEEGASGGVNLGTLLTQLVESAVKDPVQRVKMYQDAMKMIKAGMDRQAAEATRKLAAEKEQILNTRSRTEKVLSNVADGKVIVDKDGKVLMMNSAAEEISGRRLHEVVGKHVSEYLNPAEHYMTISEDMNLSGGELTGEVSVTGDEKVGGALRRSMALLEDDEGRIVGAYMTLPEVGKFKEAQRMQDEFLSKVTHDLKAPLSSISSALEMLTDTTASRLSEDERNFLSISMRNSKRLSEMIRGILDFSKLQAGKMPVNPEPCPLSVILKESVEGLMPWAKTRGIELTLRHSPDVRVVADHQRIVEVINNLVSNAIKSTQTGGKVMVAASRTASPEPCAIVGVRDNGPGIPKKEMDRIFNRFEQLESGTMREGVGLGLSIVKELVKLHNGRIWVESEEGKGTTFYFTLPLDG